jgi:hypothetical protein
LRVDEYCVGVVARNLRPPCLMSKRPYPQPVPAQEEDVSKKPKKGWCVGDRDEFGEMRDGLNPGLLLSQGFLTVDRHLWAGFDQVVKKRMHVSEYCLTIMKQARQTDDLAVKKMFIMTLMCMYEDLREYYASVCPPHKFNPWYRDLKKHLDIFLCGAHRNPGSKCKSYTDAKYWSVTAFVSAMAASYVNM